MRDMTFEQWKMHDDWGNCPELLSFEDTLVLEAGMWFRASGEVVCKACQRPYYDHPHVLGALWLHRVCDGALVKL